MLLKENIFFNNLLHGNFKGWWGRKLRAEAKINYCLNNLRKIPLNCQLNYQNRTWNKDVADFKVIRMELTSRFVHD